MGVVARLLPGNVTLLGLYRFGSRNYGTCHAASDWDYFAVVDNVEGDLVLSSLSQITAPRLNVNVLTPRSFQTRLDAHGIDVLEAWAHPVFELGQSGLKLATPCSATVAFPSRACVGLSFRFVYDAARLRHSISALVDLTWCKARKKLVGSRDAHGSRKNMFHAFRIMGCAIELARHHASVDAKGTVKDAASDEKRAAFTSPKHRVGIADWTAGAPTYHQIMALEGGATPEFCTLQLWKTWDAAYRPRLRLLRSHFRRLCPKYPPSSTPL